MLQFLNQTIELDTYTLIVAALLSGLSGILTMHLLSQTMLAMVFVPGFFSGALGANYLFERCGIYPTPEKETNVVVASTLGIVAALLILLILTRVTWAAADHRVARHQFKRR